MKSKVLIMLVLAMIVSVLPLGVASADAGNVVPVGPRYVIAGIQSCLNGTAGTLIMRRGSLLMFSWPDVNNINFVVLNTKVADPLEYARKIGALSGNKVSTGDYQGMIEFLQKNGWKIIGPGQVAATLWESIKAAMLTWAMSGRLIQILVVPVSMFKSPYKSGNG